MPDPDWNLLPHQPVQFFELPEDYTRRDLKRAYGRLIKVYRPEQQPDEFRKIRDAFEQLERWLSYRTEDDTSELTALENSFPVDLSEEFISGTFTSETQEPPKPVVRPSLEEILESHTPEEWFLELTAKPEKDPIDYIHLAIVSEVIDGQPEQSFLNWLCVGLKSFPHDTSLHRFVNQFCRQNETRTQAAEVLNLLCLALPPSRRLALTESLWNYLLKTDFVIFQRLWEDHLLPYRDHFPEQFVSFITSWLIPAAWTATTEWLEDQIVFLEIHNDLLGSNYEFTLEFYERLKEYCTVHLELDDAQLRNAKLNEFYEQLKKVCLAEGEKELEEYWNYQRRLVKTFPEWSLEFRQNRLRKYQKQLAIVFEWAAHYARHQRQYHIKQLEQEQAVECSREWIEKLSSPVTPIIFGVLVSLGIFFIWILLYTFLFMDKNPNNGPGFVFGLGTVVSLLFSFWIAYYAGAHMTLRYYLKKIQPLACAFLRQKRPTFWQMHQAFAGWLSKENPRVTSNQVQFGTFIMNDPALRIYRTALDFE